MRAWGRWSNLPLDHERAVIGHQDFVDDVFAEDVVQLGFQACFERFEVVFLKLFGGGFPDRDVDEFAESGFVVGQVAVESGEFVPLAVDLRVGLEVDDLSLIGPDSQMTHEVEITQGEFAVHDDVFGEFFSGRLLGKGCWDVNEQHDQKEQGQRQNCEPFEEGIVFGEVGSFHGAMMRSADPAGMNRG